MTENQKIVEHLLSQEAYKAGLEAAADAVYAHPCIDRGVAADLAIAAVKAYLAAYEKAMVLK